MLQLIIKVANNYNRTRTMNKTSYKSNKLRRRDMQSHNVITKCTPHSPLHSNNSFYDSKSKCDPLQLQMEISKHYPLTATSWCILNSTRNEVIGVREQTQREVASLTKIMTTIISLELFQRYKMDKEAMVRVSSTAAAHNGTSAELKIGKYIRIYDLFYGTMLPSGNDAAYLLAQIFGLLLFYESVKPESKDYSEIESIDLTCYDTTTTFINRFIKEMNRKAKDLSLSKTVFNNPHGLPNILNVSSAKDIIMLSKYCYRNSRFREVMNCDQYTSTFYDQDMEKVNCVKRWYNTNKLLSLGWEGIKTGHTGPAGACLASVRNGIFIVVLNSANRDARFEDTIMLWQWYQQQTKTEPL